MSEGSIRERARRANVPKSAVRGTVKKVFARQKGPVGLVVLSDVSFGRELAKAISMRCCRRYISRSKSKCPWNDFLGTPN
jgi:hypothetical protein